MTTSIDIRSQRPAAIADSTKYRLSQGLLLLLALWYALQVFRPIRLNTDAIILLFMAESVAHGGGFFEGRLFPPGYPALLAVLKWAGLAYPWAIVGMNLVFLSLGLFATYCLLIREFFADKAVALIICSFFLLSFVVIKHFPIPLTDVPFFCCSMCCVAVMSQIPKMDWNWRFVIFVVTAWLLAVSAILLRRVGVALLPPLLFACSPHFQLLLNRNPGRTRLIIVVLSAFVGVGIILVVVKTSTLSDFTGMAMESGIPTLPIRILFYRLTDLGELFLNLPMSKMPTEVYFMVPCAGIILLMFTILGLATKRRQIGPTEVFLTCYMGFLFAWPYHDARFWLPVIPLLIAYSLLAAQRFRLPHSVVTTYCIVFSILGLIAIIYSTRVSFAGSTFLDGHRDGVLRPIYCATFPTC